MSAFAFECPQSFEELYDRLVELGPWEWRGTESDTYGDYLSTNPDESSWIRIFDREGGHWVLQMHVLAGATVTSKELEQAFLQRIFPAIGARNVRPTEGVY